MLDNYVYIEVQAIDLHRSITLSIQFGDEEPLLMVIDLQETKYIEVSDKKVGILFSACNSASQVIIGFDAPRSVTVDRYEIYERKMQQLEQQNHQGMQALSDAQDE